LQTITVDGNGFIMQGLQNKIGGDTTLIGARLEDDGVTMDTGAAYVFTRTGTTWSEQAKLTAADPVADDWLGISVALLFVFAAWAPA